jgi:small subunit ribosomal protein S7
MARRGSPKPRVIEGDPIYNSPMISKLVNRAMKDGKKSVAQKEVYEAFEIIKEKTSEDPLKVFNLALENVRPSMEVRPRRVGGAAYQVPMSVRGPRKDTLAIRWIVEGARSKSNSEYHTFAEKLSAEIIDAANNAGVAYKKKTDMERTAEANRAFAHFRW